MLFIFWKKKMSLFAYILPEGVLTEKKSQLFNKLVNLSLFKFTRPNIIVQKRIFILSCPICTYTLMFWSCRIYEKWELITNFLSLWSRDLRFVYAACIASCLIHNDLISFKKKINQRANSNAWMIPIVDVHDNQATRFSIVDLELQIKTVDIHQIKYYKLCFM